MEDSLYNDMNAFDIKIETSSSEVESLRHQLSEEKQRRTKLNAELLKLRSTSGVTSVGPILTLELKQELEALRRSHQMRMEESNITSRLLDAKDEALALAARASQDAEFQNECLLGDVEELKTQIASFKRTVGKISTQSSDEEDNNDNNDNDDDDDDSMLVPQNKTIGKKEKSPAVLALLEEKNKLEQELAQIESKNEVIIEKLENDVNGLRRDRNALAKERDALKLELDTIKSERDSLKSALLSAVHRSNETTKSRDEFISRAIAEVKREAESELMETKHLLEEAAAFGRALLVANKELENAVMMSNKSEIKQELSLLTTMQPLEISKKQPSLPSLETLVSPKAPPISQISMDTFVSSSTTRQGTSASSLKDLTDAINVSLAMLASPQSFRLSPPNSQQSNLSSQVSTSAPITVSSLSMSTPKFVYPSTSKPPTFNSSTVSTTSLSPTSSASGDVHDYLARKLLLEAKNVEEGEKIRRRAAEDEIEMLKRAILGR